MSYDNVDDDDYDYLHELISQQDYEGIWSCEIYYCT